jgi:branched-chain amino acid transport system permease protein
MTDGAPGERVPIVAALRDAGFTALLTFGLLLPLVGFQTYTDFGNNLVVTSRWSLLLSMVAVVAVGRLAYALVVEPWLKHRRMKPVAAAPSRFRAAVARWFSPFAIGFVIVYPPLVIAINGFGGAVKWIDNFGIQILIYVMLGWGLNIVVGLAGLLDLGYVAFYAVGAYSYALLAKSFGFSFWLLLPLAGILSSFWGVLLGFPVLRLRGD